MQKKNYKLLNIFLAGLTAVSFFTFFHRKKANEPKKMSNEMVAKPFPKQDNSGMLKKLEEVSQKAQEEKQAEQLDQTKQQPTATTEKKEDTAKQESSVSEQQQQQQQQPIKMCLTQEEREDALVNAFLPMLKLNEGERLYFYRCSAKKVTVGYGSNVEQNPSLLDDVTVYCNKKPLNNEQKAEFVKTCPKMTRSQLQQYTITKADAEKMAIDQMKVGIQTLRSIMLHSKTKKAYFDSLPIPMQALCLDILYNVGEGGFKKYKRFQAALEKKDYATAIKECVVYTNKETKATNTYREARKQRLYVLTLIAQRFTALKYEQLYQMVYNDYRKQNPKVAFNSPEASAEYWMVGYASYVEKWNLREQQLKQQQNNANDTKVAAAQIASSNQGNR